MLFIDQDGNEITINEWIALRRRVGMGAVLAESTISMMDQDVIVRTVWFGMVLPEANVRAFGTATALAGTDPDFWSECEQYDAKVDALTGHTRWVGRLSKLDQYWLLNGQP